MRGIRARQWLGIALMLCVGMLAHADETGRDIVLHAIVSSDALRAPGASVAREGTLVTTTWLSGDRQRVDFDGGEGLRGRVLRDGDHAWLLRPNAHQAIPAKGVSIGKVARVDPRRPCWELGFACQALGERTEAGRQVSGWRYRHAERGGPQGTDEGEFWVDTATGAVLAFDARDLAGHHYRMQTVSFEQVTLDDDVFALPKSVSVPVRPAQP